MEDKLLVTKRPETPNDGSAVVAPDNGTTTEFEVVAMSWWAQALIRTARTYLQSLVGFLAVIGTGTTEAVGIEIPVKDFAELLWTSMGLAVAPATLSLLQNALEILARLDTRTPKLRA